MKNKIICFLVLIVIFLLLALFYEKKFNRYDVNKDGKINSLDLLILRKKLLENVEEK